MTVDGNKFIESFPVGAIDSDKRNFSLPKQPFFGSTSPVDFASANDGNLIEQVQKFMKTSPLGISYNGPVDNKINSVLLESLSKLEIALETKFPGEKFTGTIRSSSTINLSGFSKALSKLNSKSEEKKDAKQSNIIDFQKFFGLNPTGIIDDKLINAAKSIESVLSKDLEDPSIKGLLWNSSTKTFNTTVSDLQSALSLAKKFKNKS